ncbi:DUF1990 family protein [Microbacterium sp. No. 7]|uniref:DUF1990 family protein n=1 Tax=Microbacterium sp. No. 7 TaxID=1714373 RepID=UPI0006D1BE3D|nr:DUF1990 family protein [Microbacterium sp. No. 7]ALJ20513.1 hypothetical protein AOA12_11595 [Microbacterium sp. No. 7]
MRRGNFQQGTVDYAAVGASQAADLMMYPPERSVPAEAAWKLGSGAERFASSSESLLAWTPLRGAGLTLADVRPAAGPAYAGVSFDADGAPIAPSRLETEQRFDADGTPYVAAGTSLRLAGRLGGMRVDARLRVISVFEEPRRVGFVLGTIGDSVVSGEESFVVEWHDTDEVWFRVRAFDRPVAALYRALPPLVKRRRQQLFRGYLRAMSPMYATPS